MTTLGERVKAERMAKGWTQMELAEHVTWSGYAITNAAIAQIERRGVSNPRSIVQLADALGVSVTWLQSGCGERTSSSDRTPLRVLARRRVRRRRPNSLPLLPPAFLQVFASAEGDEDGAMILTHEPVAWIPRDARLDGIREAYGCFASGDSMEPAYGRGSLLLVNPVAPVNAGDDCVFVRDADDGTRQMLIRRLVGSNDDGWTVRQFNPDLTYLLPRQEWKAHLAIGKYNRWT